ncbi:CLUMA_CG017051, isoform A [Clunio marinus]|uniref:CLUMA_CG017051, isoform A n=1 Tax=Clunio marinus TaxID=568069 RepID=A0A1J1IW55_9DIPT|nr:CLUMA_CG017051, isoform A [Clunio marinus]
MDSKSTTVLTNLQRGNIEAKISAAKALNFYEKCGQGEVTDDEIRYHKNIDEPDAENGFTALQWACYYGQQKILERLVDLGANVNFLAKNYISALHLAAAYGHHEIVKYLIAKGAIVNQLDICGNTPLHFAAANNFPHSTNEILNSQFADIMIENEDGKTAYHLSIEKKAQLSQAVIENFFMNVIS